MRGRKKRQKERGGGGKSRTRRPFSTQWEKFSSRPVDEGGGKGKESFVRGEGAPVSQVVNRSEKRGKNSEDFWPPPLGRGRKGQKSRGEGGWRSPIFWRNTAGFAPTARGGKKFEGEGEACRLFFGRKGKKGGGPSLRSSRNRTVAAYAVLPARKIAPRSQGNTPKKLRGGKSVNANRGKRGKPQPGRNGLPVEL